METRLCGKEFNEIGRNAYEYVLERSKATGLPICYQRSEDDYIIREYPDGRKFKLVFLPDGQAIEEPLYE